MKYGSPERREPRRRDDASAAGCRLLHGPVRHADTSIISRESSGVAAARKEEQGEP
jgi:hypothetical protein